MFGAKTTIRLTVTGMTCGNCVQHVQKALKGVSGVKDADVDLEDGRATVTAKADADVDRLLAAVAEAGYQAEVA